jgi:hypothetical protein
MRCSFPQNVIQGHATPLSCVGRIFFLYSTRILGGRIGKPAVHGTLACASGSLYQRSYVTDIQERLRKCFQIGATFYYLVNCSRLPLILFLVFMYRITVSENVTCMNKSDCSRGNLFSRSSLKQLQQEERSCPLKNFSSGRK